MDCIKQSSGESTSNKFSKTFSKCIDPKTPSRFTPTQPKPKLTTLSDELNISIDGSGSRSSKKKGPHITTSRFTQTQPKLKTLSEELNISIKSVRSESGFSRKIDNATKEALIAKLFASVSTIKAAYAELQCAQFPYNGELIHAADEDLVSELSVLTQLKYHYYRRNLQLPPPPVAQLLAEIQEQQSNIKTYEITMKQLEWKLEQKDGEIASLRQKFEGVTKGNKSLQKRLGSSGNLFPLRDNITLSELNPCHFIRVLYHVIKSLRHFVKHLVSEMVGKNWDIDLAVKAIQPNIEIANPKHKMFVFESYVAQIMFDGFNHRNFYFPDDGSTKQGLNKSEYFYECFLKIQSLTTTRIFKEYPKCPFGRFCKGKYLKVVHPKMECSIFGNLDQRKVISSGAFPESEFFSLFAEMARRVWVLHCLAFSYDPPAAAFQVKRGCRFSEVYMESVVGEDGGVTSDGEFLAAFTVVPGFKIGKTVVQSLVYISPVKS